MMADLIRMQAEQNAQTLGLSLASIGVPDLDLDKIMAAASHTVDYSKNINTSKQWSEHMIATTTAVNEVLTYLAAVDCMELFKDKPHAARLFNAIIQAGTNYVFRKQGYP